MAAELARQDGLPQDRTPLAQMLHPDGLRSREARTGDGQAGQERDGDRNCAGKLYHPH
jgi:hypothetical protein